MKNKFTGIELINAIEKKCNRCVFDIYFDNSKDADIRATLMMQEIRFIPRFLEALIPHIKTKEKTKAYKIYDMEDTYILGIKQTIEFAQTILKECYEYLEDNYGTEYHQTKKDKKIMAFIDYCFEKDELNLEEALKIIKYDKYEIEEIEIY